MRKMRLDLNALVVESFGTGNSGETLGTVLAREATEGTGCACGTLYCTETGSDVGGGTGNGCDTYATCDQGCTLNGEYTCQNGCADTQAPRNSCYNTCWYGKTPLWPCTVQGDCD